MKITAADDLKRALQGAVPLQGTNHGSTVYHIPERSRGADTIRGMTDMPRADDPMTLRKLMADPGVPAIFIPASAIVTAEVIERICAESPLDKVLIWETS